MPPKRLSFIIPMLLGMSTSLIGAQSAFAGKFDKQDATRTTATRNAPRSTPTTVSQEESDDHLSKSKAQTSWDSLSWDVRSHIFSYGFNVDQEQADLFTLEGVKKLYKRFFQLAKTISEDRNQYYELLKYCQIADNSIPGRRDSPLGIILNDPSKISEKDFHRLYRPDQNVLRSMNFLIIQKDMGKSFNKRLVQCLQTSQNESRLIPTVYWMVSPDFYYNNHLVICHLNKLSQLHISPQLHGFPPEFYLNIFLKLNPHVEGLAPLEIDPLARQQDLLEGKVIRDGIITDPKMLRDRTKFIRNLIKKSLSGQDPILLWISGLPTGFRLSINLSRFSDEKKQKLAKTYKIHLKDLETYEGQGKLATAIQKKVKRFLDNRVKLYMQNHNLYELTPDERQILVDTFHVLGCRKDYQAAQQDTRIRYSHSFRRAQTLSCFWRFRCRR